MLAVGVSSNIIFFSFFSQAISEHEEGAQDCVRHIYLYIAKGREDSCSASLPGGLLTTSISSTQRRGFTIHRARDYVHRDLEAVQKVEAEGRFI